MYKVFPHIKLGESLPPQTPAENTTNAEVTTEASNSTARRLPKKRTRLETSPVDPLTQSLWFRVGRSIRATRRRVHAQTLKALLTSELRGRKAVNAILSKATVVSATLLSILITVAFLVLADSQNIKASETHLAAAQIIGAALALVLSLSIIPAQRAAELFSISVLKLFAKDRALISVFLVLVATTMLSLLLGSSWVNWLDAKASLSIQFILLGISFDALRRFYVSTLDLLAPESAIKRIVIDSKRHARLVGRIADKLVAMQVAAAGRTSPGDLMLHAKAITGTNLPKTLQYWSSQLEEFAHRFIARRDSNAATETIDALESIAIDYSELRKKSVTLHIDPEFLFAGALSDISDVLNPVYESIQHIIDDAIASRNERIVQHSISTIGRMALYAMSIEARGVGGQRIAPLAFAASFYLDRAVRSTLAANMNDATLRAITSLNSILLNRPPEIELTGVAEQINETLFAVAIDGMAKSNQTNVFRSIGAMLRSIKFEIENDGFDADSLKSTLLRIVQIVPFEVMADSNGNRRLQTFPAYDLGFEASIPMLLQSVVQNISVDGERPWSDPFSDLSDAMEVIRGHFRSLSDVDFKGTLLGKYVADSLDAVCRILLHELKHPPEGAETFVSTIEDDLKSQITWMSGLFPAGGSARRHHISDATAHLTILGIDALAGGWTDVARKCATTLENIASNLQASIGSFELADIHRDLEILARAAEKAKDSQFATDIRAMITLPPNLSPEQQTFYLDARATRVRQLDEALAHAGRRPYRLNDDPVERLHAYINRGA
ncbi:hypothetical protein SAMN05444050_7056 [Afipia sp. GAS231]|nr:hypothetical protein SAMN05444050_7056 [Afipia sp. GAS231]